MNQREIRDVLAKGRTDELESLRAEFAAEREKVRKFSATEAAAVIPAVMEYAEDKERQLATLTLDNQRLRDELGFIVSDADEYTARTGVKVSWVVTAKSLYDTPTDTAALDKYVAEKTAALRQAFHVNMIACYPANSHDEIAIAIDNSIKSAIAAHSTAVCIQ